MSKLFITAFDVKNIIFLIHKKTALMLKLKGIRPSNYSKIIAIQQSLNWTEAELKKYHDDDIENIERILMEGYTETEITKMFKYHLNKAKRKIFKTVF